MPEASIRPFRHTAPTLYTAAPVNRQLDTLHVSEAVASRRTVKKVWPARNATAAPMSDASESRPSGIEETNMLSFSSVRPSLPANAWTSGVLPATGQTELNRILSLASSSASDLDAVLTQPLDALRR